MSEDIGFLDQLEELRHRLIRIIIAIGIITGFSLGFTFKEVRLGEFSLIVPYPQPLDNFAAALIDRIRLDILPDYVELIVTSPAQAFISQLYMALFIGIVGSMPIIIREVAAFVNPGLYPNERRLILVIIIPSALLFLLGAIFSYLVIAPFTMEFLYRYSLPLGAKPFITLDQLISFTLLLVGGAGLSFQLPVIMWALTKVGVVDSEFWKRNLAYAIGAIIIFGAVITPDGSGVTMWFIAGPMSLLYIIGYLIVRRHAKPNKNLGKG